jgi:hypothetical protein
MLPVGLRRPAGSVRPAEAGGRAGVARLNEVLLAALTPDEVEQPSALILRVPADHDPRFADEAGRKQEHEPPDPDAQEIRRRA